jgi:hypothetical protein
MRPLMLSALLLVAVATASAQAQPVTVTPSAPTTATPVTLSLSYSSCFYDPAGFQRTGNTIDLKLTRIGSVCVLLPPGTFSVNLGSLPAGSYTVRVLDVSDPQAPQVLATSVFAVTPAPAHGVPMLDLRGILAAMLLLGFAGSFALRMP